MKNSLMKQCVVLLSAVGVMTTIVHAGRPYEEPRARRPRRWPAWARDTGRTGCPRPRPTAGFRQCRLAAMVTSTDHAETIYDALMDQGQDRREPRAEVKKQVRAALAEEEGRD